MADTEGGGLYTNLRKIIGVVDQLRDIGLQQFIKLPRIAVLGTQSSGKSSLLEMIVGYDFLPRGEVHSDELFTPADLYCMFGVGCSYKKTTRAQTGAYAWT